MPARRLAGWLWNGERLVVDDTPEGALARKMVVMGGCRLRAECTRRVRLDLEYLVHHGFARAPLPELRHRYECSRLPRCEMSWIETYPQGVPLLAYVGNPETWLAVTCASCTASLPFTFERMIHALEVSGRGDGNTGVLCVAGALHRPCKTCGGTRWRVDVVREHAPGSGSTKPLQRPTSKAAS